MDMHATATVRGVLFRGGVDLDWFAAWCGVTLRTVHHWRARIDAPGYALTLAQVAAGACPWPGWEGVQLVDDALHLPGLRDGLTRHQMETAIYQAQQVDALRRALDAQRRACAWCALIGGDASRAP